MAKEVDEAQASKLEKLKILQSTLDKIEKNYGKGAIMKLGDAPIEELECISTGSVGLDMALGVGVTAYTDSVVAQNNGPVAVYLPVVVGLKWKFAERWQLQLAWQHNVYVDKNGDALEGLSGVQGIENIWNDIS